MRDSLTPTFFSLDLRRRSLFIPHSSPLPPCIALHCRRARQPIIIIGGKKIWLEKHTNYSFDKFTVDPPGKGQVDVWYLPCHTNGTLALPKAQRGQGDDLLKRWFEEVQADDPEV